MILLFIPCLLLPLIVIVILIVFILFLSSISSQQSTSQDDSKEIQISEPKKSIIFVGATNTGKSSTINALIGSEQCQTELKHGLTIDFNKIPFINNYKIIDTPGILDKAINIKKLWKEIEKSEIVIFVINEEMFRSELDFFKEIAKKQFQWNIETKNNRKLFLFINKYDLFTIKYTSDEFRKVIELIQNQVSSIIHPNQIIFGSALPIANGKKGEPQIEALKHLLTNLTSGEI